MDHFWEMMGVDVDVGPSSKQIMAARERYKEWSRDDHMRVWIYCALPEFGATYGNTIPNKPTPPFLAYKGNKGFKFLKEAIIRQTRVINYVSKDISEMLPQ
ncbi:hypothetical protein F2Q69_00043541 [Brassica cretica]|uniref:Uncharacterized protein n=1 Tax=Brassica cretica TaxID=69181 RepID=A0A8S9NWL5_BRACR|nr:hypothetical protein F2Q69_00043541 [Brassica cretica]